MKKLLIILLAIPLLAHADGIILNSSTTGKLPDQVLSFDPGALQSIGIAKLALSKLASTTPYNASTITTYSSGTYTAKAGTYVTPTTLVAGQVFFVNFNAVNPGAANLIIGNLPTKPIKIKNAAGTALTLVGGEITPGSATLYYDGTEYIYSSAKSSVTSATTAVTLTIADFIGKNTIFLPSGAQTITLPCASTLSPNGVIYLFSNSGTITLNRGAACSTDTINKNAVTSTTTTIIQGAELKAITTDGLTNFYVSGT
jgi:hypothetical protein